MGKPQPASVKKRLEPQPIGKLIATFENFTLPIEEWTHEAHLSTALWYLYTYSKAEAICRIRSGIITYNHVQGGGNTPSRGYHETITLFWVWVIDNYLQQFGRDKSFEEVRTHFLGSKYAGKHLPMRYYTKKRLMSVEARSQWVEPDRKEWVW